jgi:hypothetical protein
MAPASRHRLSVDGRPPSRRLRAANDERRALAGFPRERVACLSLVRVLTPTDDSGEPRSVQQAVSRVAGTPVGSTRPMPRIAWRQE